MQRLPDDWQQSIAKAAQAGALNTEFQAEVRTALNDVLGDRDFYQEDAFAGIELLGPAQKLFVGLGRASRAQVERFNRLVLEAAFTEQIKNHVWETPRRKAANITAVLGNPNLALLVSAAIAMSLLVRKRNLSLKELGQTVDKALMSGGIIILITAGGGAFGAMLRTAGVQKSIEGFVGTSGKEVGILILLLAFAVASVVKFAQGSGTVSMITTASMFAAMGITSRMLGCNLVYLAMAIGSGSLVGDWMNNSGFWIFARMSVLTETETLRSWTILTGMLGLIGLGFTLLFATILPMV